MVRIAVVEDEAKSRAQINEYIERYEMETGTKTDVKLFEDGEEIVKNYNGQFDIIFMDIQMKRMDGMKAAEKIRETDKAVIFVFTTSTVAYAVQGYAVEAMGYILKPVVYTVFAQMMNKAASRVQSKDKVYLTISTDKKMLRIDVATIYYIESQRHNVIIHTAQEDYVTPGTMRVLEAELKEKGFSRCNNAYLVNMKYVEGIVQSDVVVAGTDITISRGKKKTFMDALTDYIGGGK